MNRTSINNNVPAELDMTISKDMEKMFMSDPFFLELEMLQGEKESLPDGRTRYKLTITCPIKSDLIKQFCLKVVAGKVCNN